MLIALETFTDPTDGVLIVAGRTRVSPDADVALMFPQRFREDPADRRGWSRFIRDGGTSVVNSRPTGGLERSAASSARAAPPRSRSTVLPRFYPELEPSYQVALSGSAGRVIRQDVGWSYRNARGMETGGWLLSRPENPDHIIVATVPGPDAEFSRSSLGLGFSEAEKAQELIPGLQLIGDWHLHPSDDGSSADDGQPSASDRRAWMRGWELVRSSGVGFWVGIVVTPAPTPWSEPKLHGWITTGGDREHLYCEPLRVREL